MGASYHTRAEPQQQPSATQGAGERDPEMNFYPKEWAVNTGNIMGRGNGMERPHQHYLIHETLRAVQSVREVVNHAVVTGTKRFKG